MTVLEEATKQSVLYQVYITLSN